MTHQAAERNPFILMISPELVLAAMEKSERLGKLNRRLCRPLDRPVPATAGNAAANEVSIEDDEPDSGDAAV